MKRQRGGTDEGCSNGEFRLLADTVPALVWRSDPNGVINYVNRRFQEYTGVALPKPEEYMNHLHPDDREVTAKAWYEAISTGRNYQIEHRIRRFDGAYRWFLCRSNPVTDGSGRILKWFGTSTDIQDLRDTQEALKALTNRLEERVAERTEERLQALAELRQKDQLLMQQSRLASMGEMIGNIAHQWRQPLNALGLIIQGMEIAWDAGIFNRQYLEETTRQGMEVITHMSRTIDDFRNFFKPEKEKTRFVINDVVEKTVLLIEAGMKELQVKIAVDAEQRLEADGFPNEYSQVLLNILINARDVFQERKTMQPWIKIRLFREKGNAVMTVADNAGGIPLQIIDRVFEPYFTTKGPDRGTGIGLFMAKAIVENNMNGKIGVRNSGGGAEFRLEIPEHRPAGGE